MQYLADEQPETLPNNEEELSVDLSSDTLLDEVESVVRSAQE